MRERLVAVLVGMTVAVIALYGIPRAYLLADFVHQNESRKIERSVVLMAVLVQARSDDRAPVTEDFLLPLLNEAEGIRYVGPDGRVISVGITPARADDIVQTRSLPGGGSITLARSGALVDQRVSEALLPLVLLGLALVAVSAIAGFWMARRLSRPFRQLANAASDLGHGRFDEVDVPHFGVPEAEQIGSALRSSAEKLATLVRREREFAVNASHQLRTPVTALRLELEDLSQWPETPPHVAAELRHALSELDRLSEAITDLLDLARGLRQREAQEVDLVEVVDRSVLRWQPQVATQGRQLERTGARTARARTSPGAVAQVLDVLIENACAHGEGAITVEAGETDTHVYVRVTDEGRNALGSDVFQRGVSGGGGTGVGLALARELAVAEGGRLDLEHLPRTSFVLRLPRVPEPAAPS
ncbi:HAMP domain-containing sensor histidine kinase [Intrasporangium sp. DVR]|uniref:HAMP domain-containing sensor histidine kinase n=1 Tax=Intrasporangium sp. DVR TaxID=3127867 RepID=UPI00313A5688